MIDQPTPTQITVKVKLDGVALTAMVPELEAVHRRGLRARVGNLLACEDDIRRALDRLFTGF